MNEDSPLALQDRLEIPRLALSIRLRLGRGGLYIFAVESEAVRQAVLKALQESMNADAEWREIRITPERYDLLLYLRSLIREEGISSGRTIFSVTGLPETIAVQYKAEPNKKPVPAVNALNIRREFIPDNNLSIVLWVDEETRQRLPYEAKDFWAFQIETRFFRDAAVRRREHFVPFPPVPVDEEITRLRDLLDRYHRQRPNDWGAIGQIAFELGEKLYRRSRLEEALSAFQEALESFRSGKDLRNIAVVLGHIGAVYQTKGELKQALSFHREALRLHREVGDLQGQAAALGNIGVIYRLRGELQQAFSSYQEALQLYREVADLQGQAGAIGNIGLVCQVRGELEQAVSYYQEALRLYREVGNPQGQAAILGNLGAVALGRGELEQALSYHQQALRLYQEVGNPQGQADQWNKIGMVYQTKKELAQALSYYQQALHLYQEVGNPQGQAATLGNLGATFLMRGDLEQALSLHQEALLLYLEIGDIQGQANALGNIGLTYRLKGELEQALSYLREAQRLFQVIGARPKAFHIEEAINKIEAEQRAGK